MTTRAIALVLALAGGAASGQSTQAPSNEADAEEVSLVQLIANPMSFHGKRVQVLGFCRLAFERNALYLHRDDVKWGIEKDAIWLDVEWPLSPAARSVNNRYVFTEGVFDAYNKGHMGSYSASLRGITRMERLEPLDSLRPKSTTKEPAP